MCIVENLQISAAHEAVLLLSDGFDQFGEETTLEGLRAYLLQKGVDPEAANRQVLRLTRADTSLFPTGRATSRGDSSPILLAALPVLLAALCCLGAGRSIPASGAH